MLSRHFITYFTCLIIATLKLTTASGSNPWPDFRGPNHNGHGESKKLPVTWSEEKHVTWKSAIHGMGWSTPAIYDNKIWLTTATEDGKKMSVLCLDQTTGKILFDKIFFENETPGDLRNKINCYASPSPVIEKDRVYIHFGSYGTAAIDTNTFEILWQRRDLECNHYVGPGSSPILFKNLLILSFDGMDFNQYLVALDSKSGKTIWRTQRSDYYNDLEENGKPKANGDFRKAFSTPIIIEVNGQHQLISAAAKANYSYDPMTGEELWYVRHKCWSNAPRPVYANGLVYLTTGYLHNQLMAVKPDGRGDVTQTKVVWTYRKNVPKMSSVLVTNDLLFMANEKGIATCLNANTGEQKWRKRIKGHIYSSPICVNNLIYFFDDEGRTRIIKPKKDFKMLTYNQLDDGCMASPAISGNALYLRTKTHLYRIEYPEPPVETSSL